MFSAKNNILWLMELKTVILEFLGKYQQNEVYNAFKFSLVIVWCTVIIHFVKC